MKVFTIETSPKESVEKRNDDFDHLTPCLVPYLISMLPRIFLNQKWNKVQLVFNFSSSNFVPF